MADIKKGQRQGNVNNLNFGAKDFANRLKGMRQERQARGQQQAVRPNAAPTAAPTTGRGLGYGVTDTGTPGGLSMPGGTDPRSGQPIAASQASNVFKLNIPFGTEGVTNMWGNPIKPSDFNFQVVGDGVNWQDPANAELLSKYTTPEAVNRQLNTAWAMSSLNPNRDKNMAAFIDSGHVESLLTGLPPTAMPSGYGGLFNPATTGLNTPWSQQYAAANRGQGDTGSSVTGGSTSVNTTSESRADVSRLGLEDVKRMADKRGKNLVDLIRNMRQQRKERGETGGFLTTEARQAFRSAKESQGGQRQQATKPSVKPTTATPTAAPTGGYTGALAQFAAPEGFGAGAFNRARAAGYTDEQIKSQLESLRQQGMKIGQRVDVALSPGTYGNEMAQRGAAGGFTDFGSGAKYGQRAVFLPEGSTAGGGKGVVWASGPMTDQQIYNMFAGKPREDYVLPASVNPPDQPYRAPAGTPYIDPNASPSDQARMAAGTFNVQAPTAATAAPTPARTTSPVATRTAKIGQAKQLSRQQLQRSKNQQAGRNKR
jgi:hypothetical protein